MTVIDMNIFEDEMRVLSEFGFNEAYMIDSIVLSEEDEAARNASAWCCSDDFGEETYDALESLMNEGYIYHADDDYWHLTTSGLQAYRTWCSWCS